MAKKLKVYQTSLGFFDMAIAAPSMKSALEAWGANSNLFHQGAAKESTDADVVAAAMAKPGVVLKRPVGSAGPFKVDADLPTSLSGDKTDSGKRGSKPKRPPRRQIDDTTAREAALAFEKEQARRDSARRKQEAVENKERERRRQATAKAQAALDAAEHAHDRRVAAMDAERAALDERAQAEDARWEKQKEKLDEALRRART